MRKKRLRKNVENNVYYIICTKIIRSPTIFGHLHSHRNCKRKTVSTVYFSEIMISRNKIRNGTVLLSTICIEGRSPFGRTDIKSIPFGRFLCTVRTKLFGGTCIVRKATQFFFSFEQIRAASFEILT